MNTNPNGGPSHPPFGPWLVGRDGELAHCEELLSNARRQGGALMFRGSAGIGKSALLNAAAARAESLGFLVLVASGSEAEALFTFAALQMLLMPVIDAGEELPSHLQNALLSAFGLLDVEVPAPETVALAALGLVSNVASKAKPLCLVVDDVHWFDPSSAAVLRFVARRIKADPIVIFAAGRDVGWTSTEALPEFRIHPLNERDAETLLASQKTPLSSANRQQILNAAQGNPLALIELPRAMAGRRQLSRGPSSTLPLTTRLEMSFGLRARSLPPDSKALLLVAALAPNAGVADLLAAAGKLAGHRVQLPGRDDILVSEFVTAEGPFLRFRHPLIRSGLVLAAPPSDRHAAHGALAEVLVDDERRLYHRAESTTEYDESLADELDAGAAAASRRGAAAAALSQAAALTPPGPKKGGRLIRAAQLSFDLGHSDAARELLAQALAGVLERADHASAQVLTHSLDGRDDGDPQPVKELIELAEDAIAAGDDDGAMRLLEYASTQMVWNSTWQGVGSAIVATARQVSVSENDPRFTALLAQATPIEGLPELLTRLSRVDEKTLADGESMRLIGFAAVVAAEYEHAARLLARAEQQFREQARLAPLATVLIFLAIAAFGSGQWQLALQVLDEAERLLTDSVQEAWRYIAQYLRAGIIGMQGDDEGHRAIVDDLTVGYQRTQTSHRHNHLTFMAGIAAAMQGRYDDAIGLLVTLYDRDQPTFEARTCSDALFYLAEAASARDRARVVHEAIATIEACVHSPLPPAFQSAIDFARALTAPDQEASEQFMAALTGPAAKRPFDRARIQLFHGAWLRRHHRRLEAREQLRAARVTFEGLGNDIFAERARSELRAAGGSSPRRIKPDLSKLSGQEQQIVKLVAEGLSNKEIGERLFLSHRTIASHLYRVFPKVGVVSRTQLICSARLSSARQISPWR